jgi:hypothetical protein
VPVEERRAELPAEEPQGLAVAEPLVEALQGLALAERPVREDGLEAFLGLALPGRHPPARRGPRPENLVQEVQASQIDRAAVQAAEFPERLRLRPARLRSAKASPRHRTPSIPITREQTIIWDRRLLVPRTASGRTASDRPMLPVRTISARLMASVKTGWAPPRASARTGAPPEPQVCRAPAVNRETSTYQDVPAFLVGDFFVYRRPL